MVELELDKSAVATIEKALETLNEDRVRRVCQAASKRAATTARKAGTQALRNIYAIKGVSVVKSGVSINKLNDGTEILALKSTSKLNHLNVKVCLYQSKKVQKRRYQMALLVHPVSL